MTFWSNLALAKINSRKPPKPRFKSESTLSCLQTHWNISLATLRWAVNKRKEETWETLSHWNLQAWVLRRALKPLKPPRLFTLFRAPAGRLPGRLHKWPNYGSKRHKKPESLHRISDTSYKTLMNWHTNHKGNRQRLPRKRRASTTVSSQYLGMEQALAFHIPAFTHIQRDILNFAK